mmetsp:Transcript_4397/g.13759  ORF Transcript_4397/g.13759 Transcript_4397/m.13759 type:complete len:201 (+) Transcript_4397:1317-1919(+)
MTPRRLGPLRRRRRRRPPSRRRDRLSFRRSSRTNEQHDIDIKFTRLLLTTTSLLSSLALEFAEVLEHLGAGLAENSCSGGWRCFVVARSGSGSDSLGGSGFFAADAFLGEEVVEDDAGGDGVDAGVGAARVDEEGFGGFGRIALVPQEYARLVADASPSDRQKIRRELARDRRHVALQLLLVQRQAHDERRAALAQRELH